MSDIHGLICPICRNHEAHQFKHTNEGHHICLCCDFEFYFPDRESGVQCMMAYTQLQTFRFDEARNTFDVILQKNPHDETALWGYLQAVYGIIYVRGSCDNAPRPTYCFPLNRVRDLPRFDKHEKYQALMETDAVKNHPSRKSMYTSRRDEIVSAIEYVKAEEKKKAIFDVFICTKISPIAQTRTTWVNEQTHEKRTEDCRIANELYDQLTAPDCGSEKKLSVFYSERSIKAGVWDDRQIWSALVRSKHIIVVGTQKEHLEASWPKSEWQRWLYWMDNDESQYGTFLPYISISGNSEWNREMPDEWNGRQIIKSKAEMEAKVRELRAGNRVSDNRDNDKKTPDDIRILILNGQYNEAKQHLSSILRAHPANGEMLWLQLRLKSKNFENLSAISENEVQVACNQLKREKKNPQRNEEYRDYQTALIMAEQKRLRNEKEKAAREKQQKKERRRQEKQPLRQRRREKAESFFTCLGWTTLIVLGLLLFTYLGQIIYYIFRVDIGVYHYLNENYEEAIGHLEFGAEHEDVDSQRYLGICYYYGRGVEQDYGKAVEWFQMAAEQGSASAQTWMGNCYYAGKGVEQDYSKAVEWFQMAADQGYDWAQTWIGDCYYAGTGVEQDYAKAVEWFRKAADQGYANAQYDMGRSYELGHGVEQDMTQAVEWYTKAAEQGNRSAQQALDRLSGT